jgi:hypothetical protein
LLYEACYPITGEYAFRRWPDGVPVQIHGKEDDQLFAHEATSTQRANWSRRLATSPTRCKPASLKPPTEPPSH